MSPEERIALRALRDCRVIRARVYHPGFHNLTLRGFAWRGERARRRTGDHAPSADFRLTPAGEHAARYQLDAQL